MFSRKTWIGKPSILMVLHLGKHHRLVEPLLILGAGSRAFSRPERNLPKPPKPRSNCRWRVGQVKPLQINCSRVKWPVKHSQRCFRPQVSGSGTMCLRRYKFRTLFEGALLLSKTKSQRQQDSEKQSLFCPSNKSLRCSIGLTFHVTFKFRTSFEWLLVPRPWAANSR